MAKCSLVITTTPCIVAGCLISIRPTYLCNHAFTYLFTYLDSWLGDYKTGNISETVEDRANITNGLYKVIHGLSMPTKCMGRENCRFSTFKPPLSLKRCKIWSKFLFSTNRNLYKDPFDWCQNQ